MGDEILQKVENWIHWNQNRHVRMLKVLIVILPTVLAFTDELSQPEFP